MYSMADTNLHNYYNEFMQKRSRVPGWHPSDYWPRRLGCQENANKHRADPQARFTGCGPDYKTFRQRGDDWKVELQVLKQSEQFTCLTKLPSLRSTWLSFLPAIVIWIRTSSLWTTASPCTNELTHLFWKQAETIRWGVGMDEDCRKWFGTGVILWSSPTNLVSWKKKTKFDFDGLKATSGG